MYIALYGRKFGVGTQDKLRVLLSSLSEEEIQISCYAPLYEYIRGEAIECQCIKSTFTCYEDLPAGVELLLSLGGDGTFLSSLTIVKDRNTPVAGVNFGRLGFLTSVKCASAEDLNSIKSIVRGEFVIQKRALLQVESSQDESLADRIFPYALNEISIKNRAPRMVGLNIKIDGKAIPTYWADGLLIATATGSTAYSLSCGGPVATPDANVFIITPMAPHNLNIRPLIVPDTSVIEVSFDAKERSNVVLCTDNRDCSLNTGESLTISKAPFAITSVSLGTAGFIDALNEKLLWGEDKRNDK